MRIQVGSKSSAAIQLDTGTVQGSPLLFDLFINALLRLLDSTGISHRVRGVSNWNHQVFADDLSLYVCSTEDANTLLDIVSAFQEWSSLKISIKKSLATGALYGRGETQRQQEASAESRKRKAPVLLQHTSKAVLQKTQGLENLPCDSVDDTQSDDEDVVTACDELTRRSLLQRCATCSRNRSPHHFKSQSKRQCTQCFESWIPQSIRYQGDESKTVYGKTPIRPLGIHHKMWLDAKSQRRKVIDSAIEVATYLYKNDNLRTDQRLQVISMCLPYLFSFSAPLIDWPESDLKLPTAVWIRAHKNAWDLGESTANCLFTFPMDKGGLQVKLPLGTLFTLVWGNLERCSQFDDGTWQMLALCYQQAL